MEQTIDGLAQIDIAYLGERDREFFDDVVRSAAQFYPDPAAVESDVGFRQGVAAAALMTGLEFMARQAVRR